MLTITFIAFPILNSLCLGFRQLEESDTPEVFRLRSDKERMKYIPRPILENEQQALAMIHFMNQKITENTDINWAVEKKETGKIIGLMGFYRTQPENHRTEIGYMVLPEFEGKGFVTEAINTMLEYAFSDRKSVV